MSKKDDSSKRDVFRICMKHLFGLSDHLIEQIRHIITGAGETDDMKRCIRKISPTLMNSLLKIFDRIDNSSKKHKDKKMKNEDVGITFESIDSDVDFKTFLAELANPKQMAGQDARANGMGSQAERKVAGQLSDKEFVEREAAELKDLQASTDPIDRQILNLKGQLARLYKQKTMKQEQAARAQKSGGM